MDEYIDTLSNYIDIKKVNDNLYNFRCPFCGDSLYNERKKRGYLIKKEDKWYYYCHNCSVSYSFKEFLKNIDTELYNRYIMKNLLKHKKIDTKEVVSNSFTSQVKQKINQNLLQKVSDLQGNHPAYQYLKSRNIPTHKFKWVYWTNDYSTLIQTIYPNKYETLPKEGIVFILRNLEGEVTGFQFRHIGECDKKNRFVTCTSEKEGFFYTKLNLNKTVYVLEGCVDSLFLDNSIAVLNSALYRYEFKNGIYINDCEPRNKDICNQVKKCLDKNYKTVILPNYFEGMDINDMVNSGIHPNDLYLLLEKYSYTGIKGKLVFSKWIKI